MVDQVRGKRVAQRVRRDFPGDARRPGVAFDGMPEGLPGHRKGAVAGEQRVAGAPAQDVRPGGGYVAVDPAERHFADRHQTLLAAFADHLHDAGVQVHRGEGERHQFADAKPGGVQGFQHRAIPVAERLPLGIVAARRLQQPFHFVFRQRSRQRPAKQRRIQVGRGVGAVDADFHQMAVEAPRRGEKPSHRARRTASGEAGRQIALQVRLRRRGDVLLKPVGEIVQVLPIAFKRGATQAPLQPQVVQVGIDCTALGHWLLHDGRLRRSGRGGSRASTGQPAPHALPRLGRARRTPDPSRRDGWHDTCLARCQSVHRADRGPQRRSPRRSLPGQLVRWAIIPCSVRRQAG